MNIDYRARWARLRAIPGVDAIAIVPGANMVYFTGLHLHLSERPIIAFFTADEGLAFIIPELEVPQIHNRPDLADVRLFPWNDRDGFEGAFGEALRALGLVGGSLGIDGMTMRVSEWLALHRAAGSLTPQPVERALTAIRAIKTAPEVEAMRQAVRISEAALAATMGIVRPGMTERQIATLLNDEMSKGGAQGIAFSALVQTGPNSALPHGHVTDRALGADDFLLIDYGAMFDGYPADITRTFCLGTPSAEMIRIHEMVLRANEAARAAAGPGVAMGAVDAAAREVIAAAGYGDYFIHRTGHGLGLDTHEPIPQIAPGVADLLEVGMAFTIEPGIYIPGLGGVRIEDNVVVTETGVEVLTSYPRGLSVE